MEISLYLGSALVICVGIACVIFFIGYRVGYLTGSASEYALHNFKFNISFFGNKIIEVNGKDFEEKLIYEWVDAVLAIKNNDTGAVYLKDGVVICRQEE